MRVVLDLESNNFLHAGIDYSRMPYRLKPDYKVWCVVCRDVDTQDVYKFVGEFEIKNKLRAFLAEVDEIIGHNIIAFDFPVLKLWAGLQYKVGYFDGMDTVEGHACKITDTLVLSKLLYSDTVQGHSLEDWGKRLGEHKGDFHEFDRYSEEMLKYCIQDTAVNSKMFFKFMEEYNRWPWAKAFRMETKLMDLTVAQEHYGFKFFKDRAIAAVEELTVLMAEKKAIVDPLLPPKTLNKGEQKEYIPPKLQFKKDGTPSANMIKFAAKHGMLLWQDGEAWKLTGLDLALSLPIQQEVPIVKTGIASVEDNDHVKGYLLSLGWVPNAWKERDLTVNSKKQKRTREEYEESVRRYIEQTLDGGYKDARLEILNCSEDTLAAMLLAKDHMKSTVRVPTSPSVTTQDKELCPGLKLLGEKVAFAKDFAEFMTYRHRKNSIAGGLDEDGEASTGFLTAMRDDGRIPTPADTNGANCLTADTLLVTDNGCVPIIDVMVGDLVLTHNGRYKPVVDRIQNGVKLVLRVKTDNGLEIRCTENHPFFDGFAWILAKDLSVGNRVSTYQEKEEWGQAAGLSKYYISSWGRVMTTDGVMLKMKRRTTLWDRATVDVTFDSGIKTGRGIGQLVLLAFEGERPEGMEVCHKDGNPTNNYVGNLYYGTSEQNKQDSKVHGRHLRAQRKKTTCVLAHEQVAEIRRYFVENGRARGDDTRLAKQYGVRREVIRDVRESKTWKEDYSEDNDYKEVFNLSTVVSVEAAGVEPTFDVTVDEDHSYVANGFVTHNTGRYKHRVVCNIPRATSLYGDKMRGLFGVSPNKYQLGFDFASLEARIEGHYVYKYPGGPELAAALLLEKPNDIHTTMAKRLGIARDGAKSVNYAVLYGAGAPKIAKMLGISVAAAQGIIEAFWEELAPLKALKDKLEEYWKTIGGKKFILGIDGRKIYTRSAHSLVNALFQSGGGLAAKYVAVEIARRNEQAGLLLDTFTHDVEACSGVSQMIVYHK